MIKYYSFCGILLMYNLSILHLLINVGHLITKLSFKATAPIADGCVFSKSYVLCFTKFAILQSYKISSIVYEKQYIL